MPAALQLNSSCEASPRADGQEDPGRGPGFCQRETPDRDYFGGPYYNSIIFPKPYSKALTFKVPYRCVVCDNGP